MTDLDQSGLCDNQMSVLRCVLLCGHHGMLHTGKHPQKNCFLYRLNADVHPNVY